MKTTAYRKELTEIMTLWNCGEREAVQKFLQSIYIAKGNKPQTAADFLNHLSDAELLRVFATVMDCGRREMSFITLDLLAIQPVEP